MKQMFTGLCLSLVAVVSFAWAAEGVEGTVVRPRQVDSKVKGCKIAKPGNHTISVGELIELEYTYPVVPAAIPKKVSARVTLLGSIVPSPLGIRQLQSGIVGTGTIVFFFEAKKKGKDTVTLDIDGVAYAYAFKVE